MGRAAATWGTCVPCGPSVWADSIHLRLSETSQGHHLQTGLRETQTTTQQYSWPRLYYPLSVYCVPGIGASTLHTPSHLSLATPLLYLGRKRARILGGSVTVLHTEEMKQREV